MLSHLKAGPFLERVRRNVPDWIKAYAVSLLALFALLALLLLLQQTAGARAASLAALLLLPLWFGAAWSGYGPGIVVCALSLYLAPRLISVTKPRPPDPLQIALIFALMLLISRLSSMKRRTEASLREAAENLEERVRQRTLELSQSQERLREQAQLLDLANDAIFTRDQHGVISFWNRGAAQMYGWTAEEAVGQVASQLLQTIFPEPLAEIEAKLLATGLWQGELVRARRDGASLIVMSRWALRRDSTGASCGWLELSTDITEQRRVEEQLHQSQKMESIGLLAGGVAHDFNNLLGVIMGHSELALAHLNQADPMGRHLTEIKKAAERAVSVTRQLLAFSRKQVRQPKALSLKEVASGMEDLLRRLIGENIVMSIDCQPDLGVVKADLGQMEQVIMNLAVNARDAMPKGGSLIIRLRNAELDGTSVDMRLPAKVGSYVVLAVSDNGSGMDAATKARIFEPFFTTKGQGKGTGLGLSTVYGIVKQSGGNLWVYSEPATGTTVKIYLPRVEARSETARRSPRVEQRGSETLLLVEDGEALRELAREFLEQAGYRVLLAEDARAALRAAQNHPGSIDLLLTDVVLPGISGAQLADNLGRTHPETKVLFMSGYTDNAIGHYGVLEEGVMLLEKPFTRISLLNKVREVLESKPAVRMRA